MGFDLYLDVPGVPEPLEGRPFWAAAKALLDSLEDNKPAGPFADPNLRVRSPGTMAMQVSSDDYWASPARGSDDTSRDASFPRFGRNGYPNLIVLPPEVAAPRWRRDAGLNIEKIRWRSDVWAKSGLTGETYDGKKETAALTATGDWLETLPRDVLVFVTLWDRS